MDSRRIRAMASGSKHSWPTALAALGILLVAYRGLWLQSAELDPDGFFFTPGRLPSAVVVAVSAWLFWRRRGELGTTPAANPAALSRSIGALLLACGAALFVWALLSGKSDLLLLSLAANGLAAVTLRSGSRGVRATILPCLVLSLGVRLPKPLEDELVWWLQTATARSASSLLDAVGLDFVQSGVILRNAEHTFHVIDSCSGLNGLAILLLVGLIVRELFSDADPWSFLVVALAPVVAFLLNVVRIAWIAASPDPEALAGPQGDHTVQGLAVVVTGTAMLYGAGWAISGRFARGQPKQPARKAMDERVEGRPAMAWLVLWLAGLLVLSWILPRFSTPQALRVTYSIDLPQEKAGWASSDAPRDLFFTGVFGGSLHRRYQHEAGPRRAPDIVDVLIGFEDPSRPSGATRLVSSKLRVPGPEWELERSGPEKLWLLDQDARLSIAGRRPGGERAVVITWRLRDRGRVTEAVRSLLALDAGPFRREPPLVVVRLIAYAPHDGQLALDRARQRLDRFVRAFREELGALSRP